MIINFVVNPIAINGGWSPWDTRLGGSEESVREWSWRLAERGHQVTVYHNGREGLYHGVNYLERVHYIQRDRGITINVNYPDLPVSEPTVYWTTLDTQGGWDLSKFKAVVGISHYQLDNCGIQHERTLIIPPGYDPEAIYPGPKIPRSVLYCSSPDRGLQGLLKVWPDVLARVPDALLTITYNGKTDLPNTICLGDVDDETMNELYRESDIWCHPANGGELFCVAGTKAQVSLCIPIVFPTMALAETVKAGIFTDNAGLVGDLVGALTDEPLKAKIREELSGHNYLNWDDTTTMWEDLLKSL